jgi:hypothetical protein
VFASGVEGGEREESKRCRPDCFTAAPPKPVGAVGLGALIEPEQATFEERLVGGVGSGQGEEGEAGWLEVGALVWGIAPTTLGAGTPSKRFQTGEKVAHNQGLQGREKISSAEV